MKLNIARVAALGPLGIGILFTALGNGACAAGNGAPNSGSSEDVGKNTQATITPLSLNSDGGCNAVGTFGITSPQVISFIAANASQFKNAQFQLFVQTQSGSTKQTNMTSSSANASFQSMLVAANSASAAQAATAIQSASASALNSAQTSTTAAEADTTIISGSQSSWQKSDSTVMHHDESNASATGTALNNVMTLASATSTAQGTSGALNSTNSSFMQTAFNSATVPAFFGGIGLLPVMSSSSASQVNSASAVNTAFFNNGSGAISQNAVNNLSNVSTGSHTDNTTVDTAQQDTSQGSQFEQTLTHNLNAQSGTTAVNVAQNQSNSLLNQSSGSSQGSTNSLQQSGSSQSMQGTQVYNDLETLNSNTFVLVAQLQASQASTILQLFQGSNGVVTGDQSFPIVLPSCGN